MWNGNERRRGGSDEELRARIEKLQRDWQEEQERARVSAERGTDDVPKNDVPKKTIDVHPEQISLS